MAQRVISVLCNGVMGPTFQADFGSIMGIFGRVGDPLERNPGLCSGETAVKGAGRVVKALRGGLVGFGSDMGWPRRRGALGVDQEEMRRWPDVGAGSGRSVCGLQSSARQPGASVARGIPWLSWLFGWLFWMMVAVVVCVRGGKKY